MGMYGITYFITPEGTFSGICCLSHLGISEAIDLVQAAQQMVISLKLPPWERRSYFR